MHGSIVSELCKELGIKPITLYRHVDPNDEPRDYGKRVLKASGVILHSAGADPIL